MRKVRKPEGKIRPKKERKVYFLSSGQTDQIRQALNETAKDSRVAEQQIVVDIILNAGLLPEELARLRIEDLPHINGSNLIKICSSEYTTERGIKADNQLIQRIRDYHSSFRGSARSGDTLIEHRGKAVNEPAIRRIISSFGDSCGLKLNPRNLRQTYAMRLYESTGDYDYVSEQFGRLDNSSDVLLHYIFVNFAHKERNEMLKNMYKRADEKEKTQGQG
ncbi:tyrosine-type recombinase/integrase [Sedimentisphaera salicampi]|uniref:tyrosine-type recombinase/integrase n=1 Tax=Sedimentisphaera salicampi TaxID=1941349 RepID=UPI000B9AB5AE|nr:tyrosine-type recombinase/integrase [Sedimentisphaera salicampi]OXU15407.1 site-specific tyrosine recombinase XerS [Sedimentisphaera salicampi]